MQAAQRVELQTMLSGNCTSVTMSEIANRPPGFAEHLRFVSGKIDDAIADYQLRHAIGQRSVLDIALDVSHVEETVAVAQPLRLGSLLIRHVDADNFATGTHLQRSDERVHSRAAAEVDDGFARSGIGQVKIVADAGERFD